ncbi:hypothetical protein DFA_01543 [Cavenderia fasciculata]|uniref:RING-type domain-containing protein n=1 Tax=Cavenderia fasciculata TaxID=261658 RepID=F4PTD5_CACFS|nr:uncharacterized protein DFA_01543 [Cavenderia fasciculata]EGG21657.1 hypothetical protein DFA_01543 [Cavenderia fasciculata]|eukprot:XP_004359507.1 hypothetical protein DFA_01543 [Cavenderia fasciculata]
MMKEHRMVTTLQQQQQQQQEYIKKEKEKEKITSCYFKRVEEEEMSLLRNDPKYQRKMDEKQRVVSERDAFSSGSTMINNTNTINGANNNNTSSSNKSISSLSPSSPSFIRSIFSIGHGSSGSSNASSSTTTSGSSHVRGVSPSTSPFSSPLFSSPAFSFSASPIPPPPVSISNDHTTTTTSTTTTSTSTTSTTSSSNNTITAINPNPFKAQPSQQSSISQLRKYDEENEELINQLIMAEIREQEDRDMARKLQEEIQFAESDDEEEIDMSYETLSRLEDVKVGATDQQKKSIKHIQYKKNHLSNDDHDQRCLICLEDFNESESLKELPKCHHIYHPQCIDIWLRNKNKCPLCKVEL